MRAWKALIRRVTGRSEISRILKRYEGYSSGLVRAMARSIARSSDKDAVFGKNLFDVGAVSARLADKKAISDEDKPRLVWCLEVSDVMKDDLEVGVMDKSVAAGVCRVFIAIPELCTSPLAQLQSSRRFNYSMYVDSITCSQLFSLSYLYFSLPSIYF